MKRVTNQSGSVLIAVLAILAMLALLLGSVVSYGVWHLARSRGLVSRVKADYLAEAGINRALALIHENPKFRTAKKREAVDSSSTFELTVVPWGGYLRVTSTGVTGRTARTQQALIGMLSPEIFDNAVTLIGPPYPLVVAGNTRIVGDVAIGPAGVTAGEIRGRGYTGAKLVNGATKLVGAQDIPRFDKSAIQEFLDSVSDWHRSCPNVTDLAMVIKDPSYAKEHLEKSYRTRSAIELSLADSGLLKIPEYLFADGKIGVGGKTHLKNILLHSEAEITISGEAFLSDCVLVGRKVTVVDGACVSGQIFAEDSITVGWHAAVSDFTFLCLTGRDQWDGIDGQITIASSDPAYAFAAVIPQTQRRRDRNEPSNVNTRIRIDLNSVLHGAVWSESYVELLGDLKGSVATNLFYYHDPPTIYLNWIVDGRVEYARDIKATVMPMVFLVRQRLEILRVWESD